MPQMVWHFQKNLALEGGLGFLNSHFNFFTNSISYKTSTQTVKTKVCPKCCGRRRNKKQKIKNKNKISNF